MTRHHFFPSIAVIAALTAALPTRADLVFSDNFNRASSTDIDASLTGIVDNTGSNLMANGVYNEPYRPGVGREIASTNPADSNKQLRLAVGSGTTNAVVNHNFVNQAFLDAGGFSVSLDVTGYTLGGGAAGGYGGGFGVGMSAAEAAIVGETQTGAPKILNAFGLHRDRTASDFYVGIRGDSLLVWGTGKDNGQDLFTKPVGTTTGTIHVTFELTNELTGFDAGESVNYSIYLNDILQGDGTFNWSETKANYIGLDGRSPGFVGFDNFTIASIPEPSSVVFFAVAALSTVVTVVVRRRATA